MYFRGIYLCNLIQLKLRDSVVHDFIAQREMKPQESFECENGGGGRGGLKDFAGGF